MRKKQLLKSMAFAMAGVLFASCAISASAAPPAKIEGEGTTTAIGTSYIGTITGELKGNPAEIDVQAKTSGGAEIVYDITVSWGDMKFEYDYGSTWDPSSHTYAVGASGKQGGGWKADGVNGINNIITVQNDSNFPMTADFSFEIKDTLNPSGTTNTGAVVGIFSTDKNTFATTSSGVTSTTELLDAGYNGPGTSNYRTGSLNLEMVATKLTTGQIYYATAGGVTSDETTATKSMYFALSGRPDAGVQTDYTNIGTLKVEVAPFKNATQLTKQ